MHIVLFHFYSRQPNPVYQEMGKSLRRRGHTVWIGAPDEHGNLVWHDENRVIAVQPGPDCISSRFAARSSLLGLARSLSNLHFIMEVRRFLREVQPDVVQVNPSIHAWLLPILMPSEMHFVMDIRQINTGVSRDLSVLVKQVRTLLAMRFCARNIYEHTCFCHEGAAVKIMGNKWRRRASVVPVGVDDHFLRFDLTSASKVDSKGPVRFVYIGTLTPFRNLNQIFYAAKRVMKVTGEFSIDLVGPDTSRGQFKETIQQLGIGSVVKIRPPVPYVEIPSLLSDYDVGLAYVPDRPTWHYQPTIKVLEYRAIGIPIISTDVASHRGVVLNGVNGFLVKDSDVSLADSITRLVIDRHLLSHLKGNARKMRAGRTWDDIAAMYEKQVYDVVIRKKQELGPHGVSPSTQTRLR